MGRADVDGHRTEAQTTEAQAVIPDSVTVCITSCGRLDLLAHTLASFRAFNTGGRYLINDDSGNDEVVARLRADYPFATVLAASHRLGLMGSIDRLYGQVETPYIFHLEDDWDIFGPVDWESAIAVLAAQPKTSQVCVRSSEEMKPRYKRMARTFEVAGRTYREVPLTAHPEFHGWSSNPGLIRKALYDEFAPFAGTRHDQMSARIKRAGYLMAYQLPGIARHAGHGRNVTDPGEAPRPKTKLGKFARGIKKRLYYMGLRSQPY